MRLGKLIISGGLLLVLCAGQANADGSFVIGATMPWGWGPCATVTTGSNTSASVAPEGPCPGADLDVCHVTGGCHAGMLVSSEGLDVRPVMIDPVIGPVVWLAQEAIQAVGVNALNHKACIGAGTKDGQLVAFADTASSCGAPPIVACTIGHGYICLPAVPPLEGYEIGLPGGVGPGDGRYDPLP